MKIRHIFWHVNFDDFEDITSIKIYVKMKDFQEF